MKNKEPLAVLHWHWFVGEIGKKLRGSEDNDLYGVQY